MRWLSRSTALVAALGAALFLYVASSPWLVWYSGKETGDAGENRLLVFSTAVPRALVGQDAQYFTAVTDRWRYVLMHRSAAAWQATVRALLVESVPLQPAALLATDRWFDTPTLIMATQAGKTLRVMAKPTVQWDDSYPSAIPVPIPPHDNASLYVEIPGAALAALTPPLRQTWNRLLSTRLGFTATAPDILAALGHYRRVVVTVKEGGSSIGIISTDQQERQQWVETGRAWVVEEDRFRRPQETAFRLPDGTIGREVMAGRPESVWPAAMSAAGGQARCLAPLPKKPGVWFCATGDHFFLTNYLTPPAPPLAGSAEEWQMSVGPEFLTAVPGIASMSGQGTATEAAGVLELSQE